MRNALYGITLAAHLSVGAAPAAAQAVHGTLTDIDRGRPLAGATLLLLDDEGLAVDSVHADRAGRFQLAAPRPGSYVVYMQLDGWTSIPSDALLLERGTTRTLELEVPLISSAALSRMGEMIRLEPALQEALPEICGDAFRPWEAGLLVGVVRVRATREPLPGARVSVATLADGAVRTTLSNERGTYTLCNVPADSAVQIIVEGPDGTREVTDVEIRAGTASWYDLPLGPRRR